MAYFTALRQSFDNLMSPAASRTKRPTISTHSSTSSLKERLDHDRMSPTKRTTEWLQGHSPTKLSNTPKLLRLKGSKVIKHQVATPSATAKSAKAHPKFWERLLPNIPYLSPAKKPEDELEGSTFIEEDHTYIKEEALTDNNSLSPANKSRGSFNNSFSPAGKSSSPTNLEGDTVLPSLESEEDEDSFAKSRLPQTVPQLSKAERRQQWSPEEVWLFEKINMRAEEPNMCTTWHIDFAALPWHIFTERPNRIFIKSIHDGDIGRDFRARRALKYLFVFAANARDRISSDMEPESAIARDIRAYQKWSIQDANLDRTPHIPLLAITTSHPNETVASVVNRLTDKMHDMARQYRSLFRYKTKMGKYEYKHKMPTFYGIMIKYSVFAIMTWDSSVQGKPIRSVGVFDLKQKGQDVWSGLAVALAIVKVRDDLVALRDEGWIWGRVEESDPDL